jgi:hypothetical protein
MIMFLNVLLGSLFTRFSQWKQRRIQAHKDFLADAGYWFGRENDY